MTIYTSEQLSRVAEVLGYAVVKWSVGYDEWQCFESGEDPVHMNDDELCMSLLRALAQRGTVHVVNAISAVQQEAVFAASDEPKRTPDFLSAVIERLG